MASTLLDLSYPFDPPNAVLKDALAESEKRAHHKDTHSPFRSTLDFVAQLTSIDGIVHLHSDLVIRGFGGKIVKTDPAGIRLLAEDAAPSNEVKEPPTRPLDWSEIPGMRHRSAALFCAQQEGQALAIVVSQDGDTTLFGRQDDGAVRRIGPFALGIAIAVE